MDKKIILFSAEFVSKLACRTDVIIIIIIIIIFFWGGGGFRRTKASAKRVRSTSYVRQGKAQKNYRPAFPCCVCLALLARFTPDFVPLKTQNEKSMFCRLHGNKNLVHSTWKRFICSFAPAWWLRQQLKTSNICSAICLASFVLVL